MPKYIIDYYTAGDGHKTPKSVVVTCELNNLVIKVTTGKEGRRKGMCCWEAWSEDGLYVASAPCNGGK